MGEDFIDWIKILFTNQESYITNGGHTTTYFRLEHGARQGDQFRHINLSLRYNYFVFYI